MWTNGWRYVRTMLLWILAAAVAGMPATAFAAGDAASSPPAHEPLPKWKRFVDGLLAVDLFNISIWRLGLALLVLVLGVSLRSFLLDKLLVPIKVVFRRTDNDIDNRLLKAVRQPLGWVVNLVAVYMAVVLLQPPSAVMRVVTLILQTVGTVLVAWVVYTLIDVGTQALLEFAEQTESEMDDQLVPLVRRVVRVVLFVVVGIAIIQQWGYDVTSLVAGLGIGGLAFALAAKPTLSNWFGSIMIFTDRPFKLGDWVRTHLGEGTVEEVGLRSTKIRTFSDTLITVPNADIATCAVENCSAMKQRRLRTHIGVEYGTSSDQMNQIVAGINQCMADHDRIDDDKRTVFFEGFGESSLEILVQCWMKTTTYDEFMAIKHDFWLDVMAVVEQAGSAFAFPSRSVYLENTARFDRSERPAASGGASVPHATGALQSSD